VILKWKSTSLKVEKFAVPVEMPCKGKAIRQPRTPPSKASRTDSTRASVNYASEGSPTTSSVVKPDGSVLAWQPYGKAGLLVADIDTEAATALLASRLRPV
jgi:hypothetical protein